MSEEKRSEEEWQESPTGRLRRSRPKTQSPSPNRTNHASYYHNPPSDTGKASAVDGGLSEVALRAMYGDKWKERYDRQVKKDRRRERVSTVGWYAGTFITFAIVTLLAAAAVLGLIKLIAWLWGLL